MPAYFIVDNEVTDPAGFEEYRTQVPATVEKIRWQIPRARRPDPNPGG